MNNQSGIILQGLELSVKLGWPQDERLKEQIVVTDIMIDFVEPPRACTTDHLEDTYCYDALIKDIKIFIASKKFRLIEHLGFELYQLIKKSLPENTRIRTRVTKKPAILNLTGGVAFFYGDEK